MHLFEVKHGTVRAFMAAVGIDFGELHAELMALAQLLGDVGVRADESDLFTGFPEDSQRFGAIAIVAADFESQFFADGAGSKDFLAVDAVRVLLGDAAKFNRMMPAQPDHAGPGAQKISSCLLGLTCHDARSLRSRGRRHSCMGATISAGTAGALRIARLAAVPAQMSWHPGRRSSWSGDN